MKLAKGMLCKVIEPSDQLHGKIVVYNRGIHRFCFVYVWESGEVNEVEHKIRPESLEILEGNEFFDFSK